MVRVSLCLVAILFSSPIALYSQITGNPELLAKIAAEFRDNQSRLNTWSADVEIIDQTLKNGTVVYVKKSVGKFAYKRDGDKLRFDLSFTTTKGKKTDSEQGKEKRFLLSAIRRQDGYYRYGPIEENVQRKKVVVGTQPRKSVMKGFLTEDFDPFVFTKLVTSDKNVERFCNFYYTGRHHKDLSGKTVELDAERNVVKMESGDISNPEFPLFWEYHFELGKGGLPRYVQGGLRSGTDVVSTWKNDFVEVDEVWLPSRHRFTLDNQEQNTVRTRSIVFQAHQINTPLNKSLFEVTTLPLRNGDKLYDTQKK